MDPNQPVLDPTTQSFLKYLEDGKYPELHTLPVPEARVQFAKGQAAVPVTLLPADIEQRTLPVGPNGSVEIRIVRPKGSKVPLPVVMYFHGGGWVVGNFETHERIVREIANGVNAAVVFVEYSLSTEAYAATKWVAEHGSELGVSSVQIAVAGDSAGGNMAAIVSLLAKRRGGPKIAAQVMFYPATGGSQDLPSRQQFANGYYFIAETGLWFWNHYIGDTPSKGLEPLCLPLLASVEQLHGLPRALIITAECDVLRDEGEAYARKLMLAGVPVAATRYLGAIHGFTVANVLAETPATRGAIAQAIAMLRGVFAST
jgi:acetyl esterase